MFSVLGEIVYVSFAPTKNTKAATHLIPSVFWSSHTLTKLYSLT